MPEPGFGIENLPYGVVRFGNGATRPAVRLGDYAIDLHALGLESVPEGTFAAVTDMSAPGRRILYRDIKPTGPQRLRLTVFYDNQVVGEFSTPRTLEFERRGPNQQFRIDVVNYSGPPTTALTLKTAIPANRLN